MARIFFILACLGACILFSCSRVLFAQSIAVPVQDCDRLVSHPDDVDAVAPPTAANKVDTAKAIPACQAALAGYPNVRRFEYELGRALDLAHKPDAVEHFVKAANKGHVQAAVRLADYYANDKNDLNGGLSWALLAAKSQSKLGISYLSEMIGNNRDSLNYFTTDLLAKTADTFLAAAKSGNTTAMYEIGFDYDFGWGVTADSGAAFYWLSQAAQGGSLPAMLELAWLYQAGIGTPKDAGEGLKWLMKAADKGGPDYQVRLADAFLGSDFGPPSAENATLWYRKAAAGGSHYAMLRLGDLASEGQIGHTSEGLAFYEKAAAAGDMIAIRILFALYNDDTGPYFSPQKAIAYKLLGSEYGLEPLQATGPQMFNDEVEKAIERSKGWPVESRKALQSQLTKLGVYKGKIDGNLDNETFVALDAYARTRLH